MLQTTSLYCHSNQLTSLDLSNNSWLVKTIKKGNPQNKGTYWYYLDTGSHTFVSFDKTVRVNLGGGTYIEPAITPVPSNTPSPTPTASPSPSNTPKSTPTGTPAPTKTPKPTATPAPTKTPKPTATPVPTIPKEYSDKTGHYKISNNQAIYIKPAKSASKVTIPDTIQIYGKKIKVVAIEKKAFFKDQKLKTLVIGKNVETIGKNAFASCSKLEKVTGGAGVTALGESAFSGCAALKTFPVLNKLQTIGAKAFKDAESLTKFTLAKNVKRIGKNAFNGCAALKTITVKTELLDAKNVGAGAFKGINKKATFKCPKKKLLDYTKLFVQKGAPKTSIFK